jgi:hypothetical protein
MAFGAEGVRESSVLELARGANTVPAEYEGSLPALSELQCSIFWARVGVENVPCVPSSCWLPAGASGVSSKTNGFQDLVPLLRL